MIFILVIITVYANTEDFVQINSASQGCLKYGEFMQIIPNSFGMGENIQNPINGNALVNMTISTQDKSQFDVFIVDSPYNEFYVCFLHLSERLNKNCQTIIKQLCQPCNSSVNNLISEFIQPVMGTQLNYQSQIYNAQGNNSICLLGCDENTLNNIIISNTSYDNYNNAAVYLIIDNSPFPNLGDCNVTLINCEDPYTQLVLSDEMQEYQEFCETMRTNSCIQQFQNITKPDLTLNITCTIQLIPDNYPYYVQYMVMVLLVIVILFLCIILCVVNMRFKKVKKQKLELIKKNT